MECPSCKENYSLVDVPFESRRLKFFVAEILCPFCSTWLVPARLYRVVVAASMAIMSIGIIAVLITGFYDQMAYVFVGMPLTIIGFVMFFAAGKISKYEKKDRDTR